MRNVILTDIAFSARSNSHLSMYMPVDSVMKKAPINLTLVQLLPVRLRESWIEPEAQGLEMYYMLKLMKCNCRFMLVLYGSGIISELTLRHITCGKKPLIAKGTLRLDRDSSR